MEFHIIDLDKPEIVILQLEIDFMNKLFDYIKILYNKTTSNGVRESLFMQLKNMNTNLVKASGRLTDTKVMTLSTESWKYIVKVHDVAITMITKDEREELLIVRNQIQPHICSLKECLNTISGGILPNKRKH